MLTGVNASAQSCNTFRECDNAGHAAKEAGELSKAQAYYQKACFMEAAKPFLNLRNNSCSAVTSISGELDDYNSAYAFFDQACKDGKDAGCFHLALLEADRGNLRLAMDMMKPLCDKKYIIHENVYSNGCTEYKQMKSKWKVQNPRKQRNNAIQMPVLVVTLLLPLIAAVFLIFKLRVVSLVLSGLSFVSYGYYEYGVSPYANIRIDLLIIYPFLVLGLVIFITSGVIMLKRKTEIE